MPRDDDELSSATPSFFPSSTFGFRLSSFIIKIKSIVTCPFQKIKKIYIYESRSTDTIYTQAKAPGEQAGPPGIGEPLGGQGSQPGQRHRRSPSRAPAADAAQGGQGPERQRQQRPSFKRKIDFGVVVIAELHHLYSQHEPGVAHVGDED